MSNTNPLVAQLIKLLPFLGRNVCYSDRELAMKRFRRMLRLPKYLWAVMLKRIRGT